RFKSLIAELRLYLEETEEKLGALERTLPWHVVHGQPSPAHAALVSRVRSELAGDVVRYTEQIDAALRAGGEPSDGDDEALKQYSLRQVHGLLMQAPWMKRAHDKPFGYPGDYEVMNFVYERTFEGATLFAKSISHAFLQTKPALAVRY